MSMPSFGAKHSYARPPDRGDGKCLNCKRRFERVLVRKGSDRPVCPYCHSERLKIPNRASE